MLVATVFALAAQVAVASGVSHAQPAPAQAPAPPPTEVFLVSLSPDTDSGIRLGTPENISNSPGYDNQPSFVPAGTAILFTSNRDEGQTDIFRYELASRSLKPMTRTPESEYSPTVTPSGDRFSAIRVEADGTQRLWQFPLTGAGEPTLVLPDVKPVGYHAWADARTLVLFVLGEPATLRSANVATGRADVLAERPGRCIARMPDGRVSFVQKGATGNPSQIVALDPETRRITPIAEAMQGQEDYAWLPDGRLLMATGAKIFLWDKDYRVKVWREVADLSAAGIRNITRMAVSPDGRRLAFVAD
jgi:Tol biopolymer transport system component